MSDISLPQNNTPATAPVALQHQASWRKWVGLGVLTLGLAIVIIDTTLLNVSLSNIIKDLHTDLQSLQWVITAYALVLAAFTITGGRLGDLFGRKKMFMLGAIIFAVGSFIASVSHSIPVLLLGESIIEGFGAALMLPATASLVVANFSGKDRATAFGIWGGAAGASSAVGPLLGGYLTTHYSWRWGFRINVLVAALVIIGSLWLLNESRDERKPKLDWWGVLLSSLGLFAVTFGIIESSTLGWWHAKKAFEIFNHTVSLGSLSLVPLAMAVGFVILAIFVWFELYTESRGNSPLVSMKMFQNRQFTSGVITISILSLGMTGMLFALPVFLQAVMRLDALHTGIALVPLSAAILVMAPIVGILSRKIQPRYFIQLGLFIDVIAAFILRNSIKLNVSVGHLIPGLALYGIGMAFVFAPISNVILSAVPVDQSGEASGVNNTMRQVGATLGAAIIGAAVLTSLSTHLAQGIQASTVIPQASKQQIISKVSDPNSNVEFGAFMLPAGTPPAIANELKALVDQSTTKSTRDAYIYSALFAFIGLIVALFIPKTAIAASGNIEDVSAEGSGPGRMAYATAGLAILLGILGSALLLHQSNAQVVTTGATPSISDIQNAFQPPANISTSTPTTTVASTSGPSNALSGTPITANPAPVAPPAGGTVPTTTYRNSTMGFSVMFNNQWQVHEVAANEAVAVNQSGQQVSIQSYPFSGQLSEVDYQLKHGGSVSETHASQYNGLSAVGFTTNTGQSGIAFVHGGLLYYIMGSAWQQSPLANITFL